MRALIALIVIVYLVGVGVALSPTIRAKWDNAPASDLATSVGQDLPYALTWPARVYHSMTDRGWPRSTGRQPSRLSSRCLDRSNCNSTLFV
jgi:hypothetical protein